MPGFMPVNDLHALPCEADGSIGKLQNSMITETCYRRKLVRQATKLQRQQAKADAVARVEQRASLYKRELERGLE